MVDKIVSVAVIAFIVTGVGIALRPGAPTATVVTATLNGLANMQRAAYGN
jgi:hypothetical protein